MYSTICASESILIFDNIQDESGSTLTITNVSVSDSGNYSCQPRDMKPDSVVVTILSEKQAPDALQDKTTHTSAADTPALPLTGEYSNTIFLLSKRTIIKLKKCNCHNPSQKPNFPFIFNSLIISITISSMFFVQTVFYVKP